MNEANRKRLVFHGANVVLIGMLAGIPMAMVLTGYSMGIQGSPDDWKLAHMEGLVNGLLMLAVAACGGLLTLSEKQEKWLLWAVIFTGYANAIYGWIRGLSGQAGLDFAPPVSNQLAALAGGLPIFSAFLLIFIVIMASRAK